MVETMTSETRAVSYELEIRIDGSRERVWKAMTEETNDWWLPDFHVAGPGSVVRFEARAGGSLIEEIEGGGSLLWYTVQMCLPGESVYLVGHVAPDWGGPATNILKLTLEDDDGATVLKVSDSHFGLVKDSNIASLNEGWGQLFTDGLKRHVEAG